MKLILLDENVPAGLWKHIERADVRHVHIMGWAGLSNGALIAIAEAAGFFAMITADRNLGYQQNMTGRRIGLIVLPSNRWKLLLRNIGSIQRAVDDVVEGDFRVVAFPE